MSGHAIFRCPQKNPCSNRKIALFFLDQPHLLAGLLFIRPKPGRSGPGAGIAQLVEHPICNRAVIRSSRITGTIFSLKKTQISRQ